LKTPSEQAQALIDQAAALLKPSLLSLASADRGKMFKLGPKSLDFVEKAREVALQQPDILPRNFSSEDYEIDYNDARNPHKLRLSLSPVWCAMWKIRKCAREANSWMPRSLFITPSKPPRNAMC
jgi:hypothetical protein